MFICDQGVRRLTFVRRPDLALELDVKVPLRVDSIDPEWNRVIIPAGPRSVDGVFANAGVLRGCVGVRCDHANLIGGDDANVSQCRNDPACRRDGGTG